MDKKNLIPIDEFCSHYQVEVSFIQKLEDTGLIEITTFEQHQYFGKDAIGKVEKLVRLNKELDIRPQDMDVVVNLLEQVELLQSEIKRLRDDLGFYERLHDF